MMTSYKRLGDNKAFWFCDPNGIRIGDVARSFTEFKRKLRIVPLSSIEYHMYREEISDFEKWLRKVLRRTKYANKIAKIRESRIYGEDLRKALLRALR
ncbi:hypothetical protein DRN74_03470 [Candidatus Micrarchaeota archaeon]|nr:MAG: hypothetical protein DRN74_03470 [Candidatus Micrarchaeota archaeon]